MDTLTNFHFLKAVIIFSFSLLLPVMYKVILYFYRFISFEKSILGFEGRFRFLLGRIRIVTCILKLIALPIFQFHFRNQRPPFNFENIIFIRLVESFKSLLLWYFFFFFHQKGYFWKAIITSNFFLLFLRTKSMLPFSKIYVLKHFHSRICFQWLLYIRSIDRRKAWFVCPRPSSILAVNLAHQQSLDILWL